MYLRPGHCSLPLVCQFLKYVSMYFIFAMFPHPLCPRKIMCQFSELHSLRISSPSSKDLPTDYISYSILAILASLAKISTTLSSLKNLGHVPSGIQDSSEIKNQKSKVETILNKLNSALWLRASAKDV